eukprot:11004712-Prorocentrum_lima.AAC.1
MVPVRSCPRLQTAIPVRITQGLIPSVVARLSVSRVWGMAARLVGICTAFPMASPFAVTVTSFPTPSLYSSCVNCASSWSQCSRE